MPLGVTADIEGKINIWDINTLSLRQSCNHEEAVTRIKFLSNSPIFVTSSMDKTVRMWDVRTGENLKTWYGHEDAIMDISITSDCKKVVSCSDDGTLRVYML
jgi:WD40 repeat protein